MKFQFFRLPGRSRNGNVTDAGEARFSAGFHGTAADPAENRSNTLIDNSAGGSVETLRTLIGETDPSCLFCDKPVINNAQNSITVRRMSNGSIGIAPDGSAVHAECFRAQFYRNW